MSAAGSPSSPARHSRWGWAFLAVAAIAVAGVTAGLLHSAGRSPGNAVAARNPALVALSRIQRRSSVSLTEHGKPVVFFMGAEFCSLCASERWAFVAATSRFGTWQGLRTLRSREGSNGFASLPTYDLTRATFRSRYLSLRHKEVADLQGRRLQALDGLEGRLVNAYNPRGSIPFVLAGGSSGRYTVELSYSPGLLQGETFAGLARALRDGADTAAVRAIEGEADATTSLLCSLSEGRPARICEQETITRLARSRR